MFGMFKARRGRCRRRKNKLLPQVFVFSTASNHNSDIHEILYHQGLLVNQARYVYNKISNACRKKDCINNFRFSVDNESDLIYKIIQSYGRGAFYDDIVILKDGTTFKFGFNYGD